MLNFTKHTTNTERENSSLDIEWWKGSKIIIVMEFATCVVVVVFAIVAFTSTQLDWTCYVIFDLYIYMEHKKQTTE